MSWSGRSHLLYLEDMRDAMARALRYCDGLSFDDFHANELVVDAVVRTLEIMGEAAHKIPPAVRERYPEVPWTRMYRLRNRIAHEYFGLDYEVLWRIIAEYLPENLRQVEQVIRLEKGE